MKTSASDLPSRKFVGDFYKLAIPVDSIARVIAFAILPADVDVNQIAIGGPFRSFEGDWRLARGDAIVAAFAGHVWRGEKRPT